MTNDVIYQESAGGIVFSDGMFLAMRVIPHDETIFPKGKIEDNENAEQAAVREVAEETGYDTTITTKLGDISYEFIEDGKNYRKVVHYYLMRLKGADQSPAPNRQDGEDFENIWLTFEDASRVLTHQNSKDMLNKAHEFLQE